jgi:GAF domain-containing protein
MVDSPLTLAEALAAAARTINRGTSLQETLDAIVLATRTSVPGFDHVGISVVHRDGTIETRSGTGQLVWDLDAIQYELHEGPCYESVTDDHDVLVEHIAHDQRWPEYVPRAVGLGLRSQLGLRLYDDGGTIGGLNLYSTTADAVDPDAVQAARLFATHASIALGHAQEQHSLHEAISSRKVIGQAIGIVMERYHIDEDRAFQFLVRASSTSNVKLRDVADSLVRTTNEANSTVEANGANGDR